MGLYKEKRKFSFQSIQKLRADNGESPNLYRIVSFKNLGQMLHWQLRKRKPEKTEQFTDYLSVKNH